MKEQQSNYQVLADPKHILQILFFSEQWEFIWQQWKSSSGTCHLPFWGGNSILEASDCLTVDKNAAKTAAWSSEKISGELQAAEFSSPKNYSHGHQGTVCPKELFEPGSSDLPSLLLCWELWTPFLCHNTKQSRCSSTKLKTGLWSSRTQQPGYKGWSKSTLRRRRQKKEGYVYSGAKQKRIGGR